MIAWTSRTRTTEKNNNRGYYIRVETVRWRNIGHCKYYILVTESFNLIVYWQMKIAYLHLLQYHEN